MTDPLSVAASVAGIVTIGFQIAKGLYDIAEGSVLPDILDVCDQTLEPLNQLQKKLGPLLTKYRNSSSKLRSLALRIRWIFNSKDHMLSLRSMLATQQRLLDTTLEMMTFEEVRDREPQNINYFQISLNVSVQGVVTELRDQRPLQLQVAPAVSRLAIADGNDAVSVEDVTDKPQDNASVPHGSSQALVPSSVSEYADVAHDVEAIVQNLDARIGDTAQDIWEDTRAVSRKVVKQAKAVLQASKSTARQSIDDWATETETPVPTASEPANAGRATSTTTLLSPSPPHSAPASIVSGPVRRIQFLNADGKGYVLPASQISTMRGLQDFIKSLFPDSASGVSTKESLRQKAVMAGEWDIYNKQGSIVLPRFWESIGVEEEAIYLLFRNESFNTSDWDIRKAPVKIQRRS